MSRTLRTSLKVARESVARKGPRLKEELGPHLPPFELAEDLAKRIEEAWAFLVRVQSLEKFAIEVAQIALSDGMKLLDRVHDEMQHLRKVGAPVSLDYSEVDKVYA